MTQRTRDEVYRYDRFKLLILLLMLAALLLAVFYGDRLGLTDNEVAELPEPTSAAVATVGEPIATAAPTITAEPIATATVPPAETTPPITAPVLISPATGTEIPSGPVTFTGTGTPGSTVRVLSNGRPLGDVVVDESGNWTLEANVPAGTPEITIQALDETGNPVAVAEPLTVTVTGAPVPGVNLPTTEVVAGPVVLTGTGEPGTQVNVILNGESLGTYTVGADGVWQVPLTLDGGAYQMQVQSLDAAGNVVAESNPVTISIVGELAAVTAEPTAAPTLEPTLEPTAVPTVAPTALPTVAPTAVPTSAPTAVPAPEGETAGLFDPLVGGPVVYGNAPVGSTVQLLLDGRVATSTTPDANGLWVIPLSLDTPATLVQIRVLDASGMVVSTTEPLDIAEVPVMPSVVLPAAPVVLPVGSYTFEGQGEPGSSVSVVINGQTVGTAAVDPNGEWSLPVTLETGQYSLQLGVVNSAGTLVAVSTAVPFSVQ